MKKFVSMLLLVLILFTACAKGGDGEAVAPPTSTPTSTPTLTPTAIPTAIATATPYLAPTAEPTATNVLGFLCPPGATYVPEFYQDIDKAHEHYANVISYTFDSAKGCEYKDRDEFSSWREYNLYVTDQILKKEEYIDCLIRENKLDKDRLFIHFRLMDSFPLFDHKSILHMDGVVTNKEIISELLNAIVDMEYTAVDIGDRKSFFTGVGSYMIVCADVDGEIVELFSTYAMHPSYGEERFAGVTYSKDYWETTYKINDITDTLCDAAYKKFVEAYFSAQHYPVVFE